VYDSSVSSRYCSSNNESRAKNDWSRQIIHARPAYTRPKLCREVLMDFTRASSNFLRDSKEEAHQLRDGGKDHHFCRGPHL
jgi:hypothetical protein